MRNKPFILYDDWCIIFGKDRATGEYAEGPADAVEAIHAEHNADGGVGMQPENTSIDDLNFSPSSQHGSTRSKDKRDTKKARGSDGIARALTDFVDRFGTYCEKNDARMEQMVKRLGYNHDLSDARKRVNEELQRLPITQHERMKAAFAITEDAQKVDVFFSFSDEDRLEWVRMLNGHD